MNWFREEKDSCRILYLRSECVSYFLSTNKWIFYAWQNPFYHKCFSFYFLWLERICKMCNKCIQKTIRASRILTFETFCYTRGCAKIQNVRFFGSTSWNNNLKKAGLWSISWLSFSRLREHPGKKPVWPVSAKQTNHFPGISFFWKINGRKPISKLNVIR